MILRQAQIDQLMAAAAEVDARNGAAKVFPFSLIGNRPFGFGVLNSDLDPGQSADGTVVLVTAEGIAQGSAVTFRDDWWGNLSAKSGDGVLWIASGPDRFSVFSTVPCPCEAAPRCFAWTGPSSDLDLIVDGYRGQGGAFPVPDSHCTPRNNVTVPLVWIEPGGTGSGY